MQIADTFSKGAFPPQGGAPDIDSQLQEQRAYQRSILRRRAVAFWWPRILLIVLGGITAGVAGSFVLDFPIYILAPIFALVILFLMTWRVQFGLLLIALTSTALFPQALSVKALSVYPAIPLLIWLFFVLLVQTAFRVKEVVLPSFWAIWPLLGLVCLAFISNIMIQLTWTYGVPHRIGNEPIILDEAYGIALFFLPLVTIVVTTAALTGKDHWIEYIQRVFIIISTLLALVVIIQFKRIGATIYTFRFSDPKLAWMSLKAISQILALGSMIGYVRFLYSTNWRMRIIYGIVTIFCVLGVYFCLQNSWWVEVAIAFLVITFAYSRQLFAFACFVGLAFVPLLKAEIDKLATVKTADFYRLIIWQDAIRVWRKQPLLGVGPGNFWAYDQRLTQLPLYLRDFTRTGLGVSHNGYLQILGELGPLGLFFYLAFIGVMIFIAWRLFQRTPVPRKQSTGLLKLLDLGLAGESETRSDHMLALIALGLVCGSALGDFTSGAMFLQPRQVGSSSSITQVLATWIIFAFVMYKDQLWRMAHRGWKSSQK